MSMEKEVCYWKTAISLLFSLVATALTIYLGIKGILYFMPFVVGWFISVVASPFVKMLEKRLKIVRKISSAMIIIIVLGLIVLLVYLVGVRLWYLGVNFASDLPSYYEALEMDFQKAWLNLEGGFSMLPPALSDAWYAVGDNLDTYLGQVVSVLSEPTVSLAGDIASSIPTVLINIVITIIAAYFFIADRETVIIFAKKVTPNSIQTRMEIVTHNFKYAIGGYFKAQFKIMGVIFVVLAITFAVLEVKMAVLIALLIACLDFFPILGTGTILIPWALFEFVIADYRRGVCLVVLYVITLALHQFLQPKFVADSIGLNPLATLLCLYLGYKIGGVLGMIVMIPVGLITINLVKAGAFDYIVDDVKILIKGILSLRQ